MIVIPGVRFPCGASRARPPIVVTPISATTTEEKQIRFVADIYSNTQLRIGEHNKRQFLQSDPAPALFLMQLRILPATTTLLNASNRFFNPFFSVTRIPYRNALHVCCNRGERGQLNNTHSQVVVNKIFMSAICNCFQIRELYRNVRKAPIFRSEKPLSQVRRLTSGLA